MVIISLLLSACAQGLLWSFLGLGVYITFRLLDIPDLTAEGTFPLGGGIAAILLTHNVNPILATLAAFLGGAIAGGVTGLLHTKAHIPPLLAGIITMTGLFSITSRVMAAPNLSLLGTSHLFTWLGEQMDKQKATILIGLGIVILILVLLHFFFQTEVGLSLQATGDNPLMATANGINNNSMKLIAYMLSNGLIALSGALIAQNNGFADVNSGIGTIVVGLAAIIIGEVFLTKENLLGQMIAVVLGAILYRFILGVVFEFNVEPTDTKLASACVLVFALCLPQLRAKLLKPFTTRKHTQAILGGNK